MPDYFVPIDTTMYSKYYAGLRDKGAVVQMNLRLVDQYRKQWLSKYKTFERFNREFQITPAMLDELKQLGTKLGVEYKEDEWQVSLPLIKAQMKGLIARDLWDMSEYYQVTNELNPSVQKAVELLSKPGMNFPKRD